MNKRPVGRPKTITDMRAYKAMKAREYRARDKALPFQSPTYQHQRNKRGLTMSDIRELKELLLELAGEKVRTDGWVSATHVALEAVRALEAQEARIKALVAVVRLFRDYGCPVCSGDCASANPPMSMCPMTMAEDALRKSRETLSKAPSIK